MLFTFYLKRMRYFILVTFLGFSILSVQANQNLSAQKIEQANLQQIIQQGRIYLNNKQPEEAYQLFHQYEQSFATQPEYDYWFGVAALRAKKTIEAAAALERVIAIQPLHAGARLELTTAYIQLNQLDSAERQLQFLSGLDAPPKAQAAMDKLQAVIEQRRQNRQSNQSFFSLTAELGYDSNYLNYPDSFDLFANTILQGIAILEADSTTFNNFRGTAWKRWNQSQGTFIEGTLFGHLRNNHAQEAQAFNTKMVQGALFAGTTLGHQHEVRMGLEASNLWLDNANYRQHTGLSLQWTTQVKPQHQLLFTGAYRKFNFESKRNNYSAWAGDIEWRHAYSPFLRTRLKAGFEQESMQHQETRQGGGSRDYYLSLHGDFFINERQQFLTTLGYDKERFNKLGFAVFNHGVPEIRSDKSLRAKAEWVYSPNIKWRYSLFVQYRDQNSSIDFFKLDQLLSQGSITYVF